MSRVQYPCSKCCVFYDTYEDIMTHLYWKHGTQSYQCEFCPLKCWDIGIHKCDVIPSSGQTFEDNEKCFYQPISDFPMPDIDLCALSPPHSELEFLHPPPYGQLQTLHPEANSVGSSSSSSSGSESESGSTSDSGFDSVFGTESSRNKAKMASLDDKNKAKCEIADVEMAAALPLRVAKDANNRESQYCYCGKYIEDSKMIGCDGENCEFEWYHYDCVKVVVAPDGQWLCPECEARKSADTV